MTQEQAEFAVRVMDSLREHPAMVDDDLLDARKQLSERYEHFGRWSDGSRLARAEWLASYVASCDAVPLTNLGTRSDGRGSK